MSKSAARARLKCFASPVACFESRVSPSISARESAAAAAAATGGGRRRRRRQRWKRRRVGGLQQIGVAAAPKHFFASTRALDSVQILLVAAVAVRKMCDVGCLTRRLCQRGRAARVSSSCAHDAAASQRRWRRLAAATRRVLTVAQTPHDFCSATTSGRVSVVVVVASSTTRCDLDPHRRPSETKTRDDDNDDSEERERERERRGVKKPTFGCRFSLYCI